MDEKRKQDKGKELSKAARQQQAMIGENLSFAASEAYKLLRTNLQFSVSDEHCQIIGVTSSVRGEGKSTTSANLAYTFAQAGKEVLLIDADMRLPSISTKLSIAGAPGLSNLLAGLKEERECVQVSRQFENWYILPAGDIPPNPSELLGSDRMKALLARFSKDLDVIILDLPPVNIVADALVVSQGTNGLIVVVRQNYSERKALDDCMYQIRNVNAKFLGFVMTDAGTGSGSYKRYGKYGKKYGYGYGYGSVPKEKGLSKAEGKDFLSETPDDAGKRK